MNALSATRRGFVSAVLMAAGGSRARAATVVPEAATLIAPGPEEGAAAFFATRAATGLSRALVQAAALRVSILGGPDGITAANRFAASTPADGRLLLTLPGLAAQALLVGDSRARFEPRQWPAIAASFGPAVLAGRGMLADATPVRVALPGPAAPDAAGLLALDLIGRAAVPVFVAAGMPPEAAVAAGAADAAVLGGHGVTARAAAIGLTPWFAFEGRPNARDPTLPEVPALGELLGDPPRPELVAAVRAAGAACRARGVLVLPALTSADSVALWRGAARRWTEEDAAAAEPGARRLAPDEAAAALATLCPPPEAALAYRDWLRRRLSFQAG